MERRHEDMINKYGLDNSNIGWYLVSYKQNLWEQLEIVKYYEVICPIFVEIYQHQFYVGLWLRGQPNGPISLSSLSSHWRVRIKWLVFLQEH